MASGRVIWSKFVDSSLKFVQEVGYNYNFSGE